MVKFPILDKYASNLTQHAKDGKLIYADEFDWVINRTIRVMGRRRNNLPTLINGTFEQRQTIIESIALKLLGDDVPERLTNAELWSLDLYQMFDDIDNNDALITSLSKLREEWKANQQITIFINDVQQLFGVSKNYNLEFDKRAFFSLFTRGEGWGIWGTSWDVYKKHLHGKIHMKIFNNKIFIGEKPSDFPLPRV